MSSNFDHNSIRMTEVTSSKVPNPSTSKDINLFQENGELKVKNFAGQVSPLVPPPQEVKVYNTTVEADADAASFTFTVPNPNKLVKQLEATLIDLINLNKEDSLSNLKSIKDTISSINASQQLANGNFDSSIQDLENKVSELIDTLTSKVSESDFRATINTLSSDLAKLILNINDSLTLKATKSDLNKLESDLKRQVSAIEVPTIVADTSNVTIDKRGSEYGISVDIPKVSKEVIKQGGGGLSKATIQSMIDASSIVAPASTHNTLSGLQGGVDGEYFHLTQNQQLEVTQGLNSTLTYDISGNLSSIVTARGTKSFNYLDGNLVSISGSGDYLSKSFVYTDGVLTSINIG